MLNSLHFSQILVGCKRSISNNVCRFCDNCKVGAFYPDGTPMERYVPNGWVGGLYHPKFVSERDSNNVLSVKDELITLSESGQYVGLAGLLYNPIDPYFGGKYKLTTGEGIAELQIITLPSLTPFRQCF